MKFNKKTMLLLLKKFFFFAIIASVVCVGIFSGIFFAYIDTAGQIPSEQLKIKDSKTVLYDINSSEYETIFGSENREWVDINKIPAHLKQAFIAIEDERFYLHHGIDFRRLASAVVNYIKPGSKQLFGASTITQQVVKNLTGDNDPTLKRKIQEQWRAIQLEKTLTKDQILELYLNIVPLDNGINGVQAAAKMYFGKDVSDLTLAECTSIAAITKLPVYYDPISQPEHNKSRQQDVLLKMKDLGFIDDTAYKGAVDEKLNFKKSSIEKISNHSYFTDQVINDVVRDLQLEKGYSKTISEKMVYGGGLKIYTTVDPKVQNAMDNYYTNVKNFAQSSSDNPLESAMLILDPKNGEVRGIIGGVGVKKGQRTLDRATQTLRQPGSSIKPIAVYGPAVEKKKITPNTIIDDSPITINGWQPKNYEGDYLGNISIRTALKKSRNIVAVKVLQMIGLDYSYNYLQKLGITSISEEDKNFPALSLGGLYKGVSPLEMAAAYAAFDNGGVYIKPYTYLKVVDNEGNIILDNSSVKGKAVFSEATAYTMANMLQDVVNSGTATLARLSNMPAAGKTGTTDKNTDKWFVGFTPYYVGAVWYGYDQPKALPSSTLNSALLTWKNVMDQIHKNLTYKDFSVPAGMTVKPSASKPNSSSSQNSNQPSTQTQTTETQPNSQTNTQPTDNQTDNTTPNVSPNNSTDNSSNNQTTNNSDNSTNSTNNSNWQGNFQSDDYNGQ